MKDDSKRGGYSKYRGKTKRRTHCNPIDQAVYRKTYEGKGTNYMGFAMGSMFWARMNHHKILQDIKEQKEQKERNCTKLKVQPDSFGNYAKKSRRKKHTTTQGNESFYKPLIRAPFENYERACNARYASYETIEERK